MSATKSKKYKLFSANNGEKPKCAFYASPAGCRNGDNCKFLHEESTTTPAPVPVQLSEESLVSSESEGEMPNDEYTLKKVEKENCSQKRPTEIERKKKRKSMDIGDIFSKPRNLSNERDKKTQKAANSSKKLKPNEGSSSTISKIETQASPQTSKTNLSSFVSSLPVSSFSISNTKPPTPRKECKNLDVSANIAVKNEIQESKTDQVLLPTSSTVGRKWQKSVVETRKHERYATSYDFKKWKENTINNGIQTTWVKAKPYGSWCESNPQAIAIDCEMCETQDPLSGSKNPKALCRLSVVNAEKPEEVLLDTLVKPIWTVTDYRTRINGIEKEHLENVEFTLRHAQAFMLKLCSQETVIVGHAVHNDLVALNMEHDIVADSSYLFRAKDTPNATPSLKDTVKTMLKKDMPDTHDSVNDAMKALECVWHWIRNDGNVEMVERTIRQRQSNAHQLFIHRIPKICNEEHLRSMFLKHSFVQPVDIDEIQFSSSSGKTFVNFKSPRHANLAFDTLDGCAEEEKSGRLQKKVYLRNGDYIRVRKMVFTKRPNTTKIENK
mmetsp:Transcript_17176/g.39673  ORF Transcript_17176/g.39673 Transcript_17176/m.39673 type:complete len:553 (+) Transcript_17176:154-1812(+)|eukprot:CAMPEP_0197173818 /NCGR_PEP_ID=MMETSP1423-20130617/600_1 /TAXON_ID=476441 /ORGANISM="Pseudo-nitzschia heimii, Strain UNC1101" /LENGTH=552 /DNA_ID=CAMNT_0042622683 /DNA_START=152 /DNA_END=1810 /DNA_ORIENTATION=+